MPRPRSFSESESLDRVLDAFWTLGFDGTSMQALVDSSGVHRASLYSAFGNKEELYRAALERYAQRALASLQRLLASEADAVAAIEKLLLSVAGDAGNGMRGCFMVNAATERGAADPRVRRIAGEHIADAVKAIEAALRAAQAVGSVPRDADARGLAELVMATVQGMRVLARAGAGAPQLRRVAKSALRAFR